MFFSLYFFHKRNIYDNAIQLALAKVTKVYKFIIDRGIVETETQIATAQIVQPTIKWIEHVSASNKIRGTLTRGPR